MKIVREVKIYKTFSMGHFKIYIYFIIIPQGVTGRAITYKRVIMQVPNSFRKYTKCSMLPIYIIQLLLAKLLSQPCFNMHVCFKIFIVLLGTYKEYILHTTHITIQTLQHHDDINVQICIVLGFQLC